MLKSPYSMLVCIDSMAEAKEEEELDDVAEEAKSLRRQHTDSSILGFLSTKRRPTSDHIVAATNCLPSACPLAVAKLLCENEQI